MEEEQEKKNGENAQEEAQEEAAPTQFLVRDMLKLRNGSSKISKQVGTVDAGTRVIVVQALDDRAQIALVGRAAEPLGWVSTHANDGFANLREAEDETPRSGLASPPLPGRNRHRRASVFEALIAMTPKMMSDPKEQAIIEVRDAWIGAVRRCVLLSGLPEAEQKFVLQATRSITTTTGEVIFKQGDPIATGMLYLVSSGVYRVTIETVPREGGHAVTHRVREYGPQENFGASDFMCADTHGVRTYSVEVVKAGMLWGVPRRIIDMKLRVPSK